MSSDGKINKMIDLFPGHEIVPTAPGSYDILLWIEWVDLKTGQATESFEWTGAFTVEE